MSKYIVRVYLSSFYDIEVEARNEDEAKEIAESNEYWDLVDPKDISLQEGESQILDNYDDGSFKVTVNWDTDGEDVGLPTVVSIPPYVYDIADWLSDEYGYCVNCWDYYEDS